MPIPRSSPTPDLSVQAQIFFAETSNWISDNWLKIAIAVGFAATIVTILLAVQKVAQRLCQEGEALVSWRTIIGRLAARTKFWFLVIVAARIVSGYAETPQLLDQTISFFFTIGMTVQAAIWVREVVLGFVEHRAGGVEHEHGALASAMGIIRVLVTFLVFAIAFVLILGNLGVNVAGLVAGLGVGGIAIGLAAQGIFSDLFAGISILFDRPFKVGQTIGFGEHLGSVVGRGMRTPPNRRVTGELLIVSNKNLLDKEIRNVSARHHIRLSFMLGVTYETDPRTLARIPAMLREIGEAENTKVSRAGFDAFAASSLDFAFIVDVAGAEWAIAHPVRDRLLIAIVNRFAAEGINFAYPTQTSYTAAPDGTLIMPYAEENIGADRLAEPDGTTHG